MRDRGRALHRRGVSCVQTGVKPLLLAAALAVAACHGGSRATTPRPPEPTPVTTDLTPGHDLSAAQPTPGAPAGDPGARPGTGDGVYDLEEIKLTVSRDAGGEASIDATSALSLLDRAQAALQASRPAEAIALYRQLAREFPASRLAPAALYDIGVLYERQGNTVDAIAAYRDLVTRYPTGPESLDAHLRIAGLLAEKKDWKGADTTLVEILARTDLAFAERLEAQARRGYVQLELGDAAAAETHLRAAIATWNRAPRIDDHYYIAMAHYYLGELHHREFAAVKLRSADDLLKADLVRKEAAAAAAYDEWREALELQDPYWALAAGYQMSQIFFELWQTAVTSPFPDGLAADARTYYTTDVHDRVRRHLQTALDGHQMNVRLAGAYGVTNAWSEASRTRALQAAAILAREARGEMVATIPEIAPSTP